MAGPPFEMHRGSITRNSRRGSQNGWCCLIDHSGTQSHHPPLQSRLHAHARQRATPLPTTRLSSAPTNTRLHEKTQQHLRKQTGSVRAFLLFLFTGRGESSPSFSKATTFRHKRRLCVAFLNDTTAPCLMLSQHLNKSLHVNRAFILKADVSYSGGVSLTSLLLAARRPLLGITGSDAGQTGETGARGEGRGERAVTYEGLGLYCTGRGPKSHFSAHRADHHYHHPRDTCVKAARRGRGRERLAS